MSLSWPLCDSEAVSLLSWVALLVLEMVGVVGGVLSSRVILLVKFSGLSYSENEDPL